ncbi:hypothetical protein [Olivibacter jilunii]|uniref:hypothetical protein n=1 Tax=Olivibacter jilunii TaxID=985016 RepID=UPI003F5CD577
MHKVLTSSHTDRYCKNDMGIKMSEGEENTGVRLVKVPIPTLAENTLRWGADNPVLRLTEVYYTGRMQMAQRRSGRCCRTHQYRTEAQLREWGGSQSGTCR